jgi:hypothetical protein
MSTQASGTLRAPNGTNTVRDCYAVSENDELVIGNAHVERRWLVRKGLLHPTSLRDRAMQREWLIQDDGHPSPTATTSIVDETRLACFESCSGQFGPTQEESIVAELTAQGDSQQFRYRFQVFPSACGISVQLAVDSHSATTETIESYETAGAATSVEKDVASDELRDEPTPDVLEYLRLAVPHYRLVQVTLRDQTDIYNELVHENEWLSHPKSLVLSGNLFFVEDVFSSDGLVILKKAPLPHARPQKCEYDVLRRADELRYWVRARVQTEVRFGAMLRLFSPTAAGSLDAPEYCQNTSVVTASMWKRAMVFFFLTHGATVRATLASTLTSSRAKLKPAPGSVWTSCRSTMVGNKVTPPILRKPRQPEVAPGRTSGRPMLPSGKRMRTGFRRG